jgi:hypothetical protein
MPAYGRQKFYVLPDTLSINDKGIILIKPKHVKKKKGI